MAYTKITSDELVICANHPRYSDTKNRACAEIYSLLETEHTDGFHDDRNYAMTGEIDTFAGNGATRTIILSNTDLVPKYVGLWENQRSGNFLSNGDFETDMTGWSFTGDGSATGGIGGGQAGNCCEIDNNGTAADYIRQTLTNLIVGRSYTFSAYCKNGTITGGSAYIQRQGGSVINIVPNAGWVQYSETFTATTSSVWFALANNENVQNGTILFDTAVVVENTGSEFFKTYDMADGDSCSRKNTSFIVYGIDSLDTGEFTIPANASVNTNGETNYYFVLGIDTASIAQAGGGSDPDWVTDGDAGLGDGTGTSVASQVEDDIYTAFDNEHNGTTGVHDPSPFSGLGKIEVGLWTGTNGDDVIELADDTLDIKYMFYFRDAGTSLYSASESMSAGDSKADILTAFSVINILSIGTGTFTARTTTTNVWYYCALGI